MEVPNFILLWVCHEGLRSLLICGETQPNRFKTFRSVYLTKGCPRFQQIMTLEDRSQWSMQIKSQKEQGPPLIHLLTWLLLRNQLLVYVNPKGTTEKSWLPILCVFILTSTKNVNEKACLKGAGYHIFFLIQTIFLVKVFVRTIIKLPML